MKSTVFFSPARGTARKNKFDRITELLDQVGALRLYGPRDLVAVKIHWGEIGNADFVPSFFIRHIVQEIAKSGCRNFVTDSNTLYRGSRHDAAQNLQTAAKNGFTPETLGCPLVVADGLRGMDYREVAVEGRYVDRARVASAIAEADGLVVVSHVKGHMVFGFGGALKNLGMGCSAAAAKQFLHADVRPRVKEVKCTACRTCVRHCRFGAISLTPPGKNAKRVAQIDHQICTGCGECIVVCPEGAIPINWGGDFGATMRKTAEYGLAAQKGKEAKTVYVNFLTHITPDCDCCDWSDAPIVPDIGYLTSTDAVAIDQASVDLVNSFTGFDDRPQEPSPGGRFRAVHDVDHTPTLEHAESLGLGTRDYELVRLA